MQKPLDITTFMGALDAKGNADVSYAPRARTSNLSQTLGDEDYVHSESSPSEPRHDIQSPPEAQPSPTEDAINPSHYRKHPSGIECIDIVRHMNFNIGNAIKYLWRAMDKGDPIENFKKAQWYIDDEIRRLQGLR